MSLEIIWKADFDSINQAEYKDGSSLLIEGTLIDTSVNSNKWAVDEDELINIAKQVAGSQLRIDHGQSVRDIIGGMTDGIFDKESKKVRFKGEVDDPEIIRKILKGRVKSVSAGMSAEAFCSGCGKPTRPIKKCECRDIHENIRNSILKETSIVSSPAYKNTTFEPMGFAAGVEKVLVEPIIVTEEKVTGGELESATKTEEKIEEKKEMSTEKKEEAVVPKKDEDEDEAKKEETTQKPAGPDAFVLLGEMIKKEIAGLSTKFEEVNTRITKMEDEIKKVKVPEMKKEPEEDDEEEEEKPKVKKEVVKGGAKVDTSQDIEASTVSVSADSLLDRAWEEVKAAAKKYDIV